ncbi:GNAT family N-acetyltransferase [Rheinheimera riviphila]|nr:GNAT family N-acetyltransferase [Rheinheimera riviphila]
MQLLDFSDPGLSLRLAEQADDAFFQQLFAANHPYLEHCGLPEPMVRQLLQQQYQLQLQSYLQQTPKPDTYLLLNCTEPVGRLMLARHVEYLHLTDLAFLPSHCGRGFGSKLIQALQQYARRQQLALSLLVDQQNSGAYQFYLRHDFKSVAVTTSHYQLCWRS